MTQPDQVRVLVRTAVGTIDEVMHVLARLPASLAVIAHIPTDRITIEDALAGPAPLARLQRAA